MLRIQARDALAVEKELYKPNGRLKYMKINIVQVVDFHILRDTSSVYI